MISERSKYSMVTLKTTDLSSMCIQLSKAVVWHQRYEKILNHSIPLISVWTKCSTVKILDTGLHITFVSKEWTGVVLALQKIWCMAAAPTRNYNSLFSVKTLSQLGRKYLKVFETETMLRLHKMSSVWWWK